MPKYGVVPRADDNDLVTKGYLRSELSKLSTKKEFQAFKFEIRTEIAEALNEFSDRFVTKDIWARDMDLIMGVLKAIQEDLAASLYRQQDHSQRLEVCESRLEVVEQKMQLD